MRLWLLPLLLLSFFLAVRSGKRTASTGHRKLAFGCTDVAKNCAGVRNSTPAVNSLTWQRSPASVMTQQRAMSACAIDDVMLHTCR